MAEQRKAYHETVAEKIIQQLEQGTAPWQKPWKPGDPSNALPINPTTGKRYRGINALFLMAQDRADPRWMTYKQAVAEGAQVRKGEKGTPVQYWKFHDEFDKKDAAGNVVRDGNGDPVKVRVELQRPRVFFATVFNAEQIDGLPERQTQEVAWNASERAEAILANSGAKIRHAEGNRAFYSPGTDSITLPERSQFPTADAYYATALHELGHWTGHPSRLDRDLSHPFGSEGYAKEELRAEISSMLVGESLNLGHDPGQHVAYVGSWIKALREDPNEIFRAAADAEKIHDLVMSCEQQQRQTLDQAKQPHEMTLQQFIAVAEVKALENHGRKWEVHAGGRSAFSDADSAEDAMRDVHRAMVNNALFINSPSHSQGSGLTSSMPPRDVLADYPDLVKKYPDAFAPVQGGDSPALPAAQAAASVSLDAQTARIVLALEAGGWQRTDGAALARKPVDTVNGERDAFAYLTPGDGIHRTLRFQYESEGRNVAAAHSTLIPVAADSDQTDTLAAAGIAAVEKAIQQSYGVRLANPAQTVTMPIPFIDTNGSIRHGATADEMPADWKGLAQHNDSFFYVGYDSGERSFTALKAKTLAGAMEKARRAQALEIDVSRVLADPASTYSHYESFKGATLEGALRERGLTTLLSITGTDPQTFYDTAQTRLSSVFGLEPDDMRMSNAYLERKGLTCSCRELAEKITEQRQQPEHDMHEPTLEVSAMQDWRKGFTTDEAAAILAVARAREDRRAGLIDDAAYARVSRTMTDEALPTDWNGRVQIMPSIAVGAGPNKHVAPAADHNAEPEFFGVYAQRQDGTHAWLGDCADRDAAERFAHRLAVVDALSTGTAAEKALSLARLHEERVRNDPASTDEDRSSAKADRKNAEMNLMMEDEDMKRALESDRQAAPVAAAPAVAPAGTEGRTYLDAPRDDRKELRMLGADWDRERKSWFIPPGVDPARFEKWPTRDMPAMATAAVPAQARQYLSVPFAEKDQARAAGAAWDKDAKKWYIGPNADLAALKRWEPGRELTPRDELHAAMQDFGFVFGRDSKDHPIMDGQKHRCAVIGDKGKETSGFYRAFADGRPAAVLINNRTGQELKWKATGHALSSAAKASLHAEAATKLAERAAALERTHEATAERLQAAAASLVPVTGPTPYLASRNVAAAPGILTDSKGQDTFVPAYDADGKHWTTQFIKPDGTKRFAKDSRKEGCFHVVGGFDELAKAPAIVIGEGYATAASLSGSLGFATVAAFDAGNLSAVAKSLHQKYPDKPIVIAGDDDRAQVLMLGRNPGCEKAEEAASLVGGTAVFPTFHASENQWPKHVKAVTPESWKEHSFASEQLQRIDGAGLAMDAGERKALEAKLLSKDQLDAVQHMKRFSDFNDLERSSVFSREGLDRQIRPVVARVVEEKSREQVQQREQRIEQQMQDKSQRQKRSLSIG